MNQAGYRKAVFNFVIFNAVSADKQNPRLAHFIQAAAQNFPQHGNIHCLDGKANNIHRSQGFAAHGVDIVERVSRGDLTECIGIVNNRGKKIDRLDKSKIGGKFIHSGIFRMLDSGKQIRIRNQRQIAQYFGKVTRTYLTGSTRSLHCLC